MRFHILEVEVPEAALQRLGLPYGARVGLDGYLGSAPAVPPPTDVVDGLTCRAAVRANGMLHMEHRRGPISLEIGAELVRAGRQGLDSALLVGVEASPVDQTSTPSVILKTSGRAAPSDLLKDS